MNRPKKLLLFFFRLCIQHVKERFALSGDGEQVGGDFVFFLRTSVMFKQA